MQWVGGVKRWEGRNEQERTESWWRSVKGVKSVKARRVEGEKGQKSMKMRKEQSGTPSGCGRFFVFVTGGAVADHRFAAAPVLTPGKWLSSLRDEGRW